MPTLYISALDDSLSAMGRIARFRSRMPPALVMLVILVSVAKLHAVKINPDLPPRSVQYNASGTLTGINELPLDYISEDGKLSLVKAPGCAPQQVNLVYIKPVS